MLAGGRPASRGLFQLQVSWHPEERCYRFCLPPTEPSILTHCLRFLVILQAAVNLQLRQTNTKRQCELALSILHDVAEEMAENRCPTRLVAPQEQVKKRGKSHSIHLNLVMYTVHFRFPVVNSAHLCPKVDSIYVYELIYAASLTVAQQRWPKVRPSRTWNSSRRTHTLI